MKYRDFKNIKKIKMSVGSNINTTSSSLWNEALNLSSSGKVKIKKSDMIKHPIFSQASEYITEDPYWKEIFIKAGKGKFPRGFSYSNGVLHHRNSGMGIQLPEDLYSFVQAVILFMRQKGNIYSEIDLKNLELIAQQYTNTNEDDANVWSKIYSLRKIRAVYIHDYVNRKYSHLSRKIRDELFTQINIHINLKSLHKEDFQFVNGQIEDVDGITATPEGIVVTRNLKYKSTPNKYIESKKELTYYQQWCEYYHDYLAYTSNVKSNTLTLVSLSGSDS